MIMLCLVSWLVLELIGWLALVLMEGSQGEVSSHVSWRMKIGILRVSMVIWSKVNQPHNRALAHQAGFCTQMSDFQEQRPSAVTRILLSFFAYVTGQNRPSQKCHFTPASYLLPAEPEAPLASAPSLLLTHSRAHGYGYKLLPLRPSRLARAKAGILIHASSRHSATGLFLLLHGNSPRFLGQ